MNTETFPGFASLVKPFRFAASPYEYKVTALRECPTPDKAAAKARIASRKP
ncbi:MAG: hypothetical protein WCS42_08745 [Verrucomicrobiota bacterium]